MYIPTTFSHASLACFVFNLFFFTLSLSLYTLVPHTLFTGSRETQDCCNNNIITPISLCHKTLYFAGNTIITWWAFTHSSAVVTCPPARAIPPTLWPRTATRIHFRGTLFQATVGSAPASITDTTQYLTGIPRNSVTATSAFCQETDR